MLRLLTRSHKSNTPPASSSPEGCWHCGVGTSPGVTICPVCIAALEAIDFLTARRAG